MEEHLVVDKGVSWVEPFFAARGCMGSLWLVRCSKMVRTNERIE